MHIDPVAPTRSLVDIDSTTGREGGAGAWLAAFLRERGYDVSEQTSETRIGRLFVVGEERGSDGARAAVPHIPRSPSSVNRRSTSCSMR